MITYFATPERENKAILTHSLHQISNSPLLSGLLNTISGFLAVLNDKRQILTVNRELFNSLGFDSRDSIFGLRPGEVLNCVHSKDMPSGCGTGPFCASCEAAIAIVSSIEEGKPVERNCAIDVQKDGEKVSLMLKIRSQPVTIEDQKLILLFMQDITREQQLATLEHTFFHDINNILMMLITAADLQQLQNPSELNETIQKASHRLKQEVAAQRSLIAGKGRGMTPELKPVSLTEITNDLESFFENHPASFNKKIIFNQSSNDLKVRTDAAMLQKILSNMIINALEASTPQEAVIFTPSLSQNKIVFEVSNKAYIPAKIGMRIFQKNFSTKANEGRGMGTWSMKYFGEKILGGKVSFRSSADKGTTFKFEIS